MSVPPSYVLTLVLTPSYKQLIPGSERPFRETYFFLHFSLRLSRNNHSRVISIAKFGPTTSDFGYDFWCKKAPLKHHRTVHWKRGLNANEYNCDTFPTKDTQFDLMDQLVNLGHPQNWAWGAQNYPKTVQNGPKCSKIAQKTVLRALIDPNSSNCPGKSQKWSGGIQHDLFEPMSGVGCPQNGSWRAQNRQKMAQNAPKWLEKQFCGSQWIRLVQIVWKTGLTGVRATS